MVTPELFVTEDVSKFRLDLKSQISSAATNPANIGQIKRADGRKLGYVLGLGKRMKILIVCYFFPPQNIVASQRPYSWAKYWSRLGHDVVVLTPTKDLSKSDLSPKSFDGFRVIEAAPSPLLALIKRLLGKNVLADAKSRDVENSANKSSKVSVQKAAPLSLSGRIFAWLKSRGLGTSTRMPDVFDLWFRPGVAAIPNEKFDVIVSTYGPYVSHLVGWQAKRRSPNAVWVCDFRDLWVRNYLYRGLPGFSLIERWLERFLLARCQLATTVSEPLAEALREDYPKLRVETIANGVDFEELAALPATRFFPEDGRRRIVYTGSLHPVSRNPRPLLEALARLPRELQNRVEVVVAGPNSEQVRPDVVRLGLSQSVQLLGSVQRVDALRMQRDADILLILENEYKAGQDGVLTGKLFEYLAAKKPVWAVGVGEGSSIGRLLAQHRAGRAFGTDETEIQRALEKLLLGRDQQSGLSDTHLGTGSHGAIKIDLSAIDLSVIDREKLATKLLQLTEQLTQQGV